MRASAVIRSSKLTWNQTFERSLSSRKAKGERETDKMTAPSEGTFSFPITLISEKNESTAKLEMLTRMAWEMPKPEGAVDWGEAMLGVMDGITSPSPMPRLQFAKALLSSVIEPVSKGPPKRIPKVQSTLFVCPSISSVGRTRLIHLSFFFNSLSGQVGGIPNYAGENSLREYFQSQGVTLNDVYIPPSMTADHKRRRTHKGFGFIEVENEKAQQALLRLVSMFLIFTTSMRC